MNESAPQKPAPPSTGQSVDFGYTEVPRERKSKLVREVFDSVAT